MKIVKTDPIILFSKKDKNTIFDKKYYDEIWNTVHRHDYCESLANSLIEKYGKVKILDIGTGCGFLVKTLREKGCDAWGLEISEYAIQNTCAPGYVLKGDVRDIPFKDKFFDVVFSQGLWEYIPEKDVQRAWLECNRVGKIQEHNFDVLGSGLGEEGFATAKPREWWDEKLKLPKILIAAPYHSSKAYALDKWQQCVNGLEYPNKEILLVDNPIETLSLPIPQRIAASMEIIRKKFLKGDYKYWFYLGSDLTVTPDFLNKDYGMDLVAHCYPDRACDGRDLMWFDCSIFSKKIMRNTDFTKFPQDHHSLDGWWEDAVMRQGNYKMAIITDLSKIHHYSEEGEIKYVYK